MKIVILSTSPISLRFFRGIVGLLKKRDVEVHVVSSGGCFLDEFATQFSVESHAIDMRRSIAPLKDLLALWQLIRLFHKLRPEIVHAHTPKAGLLGMLAAFVTRVPVRIYHLHGLPLLTASVVRSRILLICDQIACAIASQVYCVSESLRVLIEQMRICSSRKLAVIENGSIDGVDAIERFNPSRFDNLKQTQIRFELKIPQHAKVIGFVGRLVRDKGIEELLAAWNLLCEEFDDLRLLLVGDFEIENPLPDRLIECLRSDPRIIHVPFTEVPERYFSIMSFLAFPTYREGFGLVAIEAAALAIPVIATRIPGCLDAVLDGITGTLVAPRNAAELGDAMRKYLTEPETALQHGLRGRDRVLSDFVPEIIQERQWQEYCRLLYQAGLKDCFASEEPSKQCKAA